ncbi:hypothetical protein [Myceligenerans pegani]|uniref:Uncharacterized protein n=1 Tax=Myceligenerans pegani TaxID=2776917 RepID=A0ABR9MXW3_9MICO|nr:hypothetical protein [Myceligenerans sp. TRM 65318]MBE1875693.1 hypothetical protein [Myceligenerans sp. TRM 65318]MBE3017964.1 hypothetical protein [Myceligenerans sp. TRM 65318]
MQVLATFRGPDGVVSETVTSVESEQLAGPLVESLNRVSAAAALPVCLHDQRGDRFDRYPHSHLAALTDSAARPGLLRGAHSLWYVLATWELHEALTDLDDALKPVPAPVRTAIQADLESEAKWLRTKAVEEISEDVDEAADSDVLDGKRRRWEPTTSYALDDQLRILDPIPSFVSDSGQLGVHLREALDKLEAVGTDREIERAASDLRLLLDAWARAKEADVEITMGALEIMFDPSSYFDQPDGEGERLYVNVHAPQPGGKWGRHEWGVAVDQWVTEGADEDGYPSDSHGEEVLHCALPTSPTLTDLLALLDQARDRIQDWADTPVGQALEGTAFVVTRRAQN